MNDPIVLMILYGLLALAVSFLCSLLEAALLSIPGSHIAMLVQDGSRTGQQLEKMKAKVDRPLAAILTLNTVAHTVGAAGVGAQSAVAFGEAWVGVTSAVITLLILVLSEIIPKTLGAVHAKGLAGFTAVAIRIMMFVTYPLVVVLEWLGRVIGRRRQREALSRGELIAAIRMGRQAGALDAREYEVAHNLMSLGLVKLHEILTPRTVVYALPETYKVAEALEDPGVLRHARIPVYRETLDNVTGYVVRSDLHQALRRGQGDRTMTDCAHPIRAIPEQASVADALETMLGERELILLVVDEYGGFEGIVTLEDAVEALLGREIVDETDPTQSLRTLARRISERRRSSA
ncbi:MAG: CNNM domain-containing protein [Planctomycetota bacterium]